MVFANCHQVFSPPPPPQKMQNAVKIAPPKITTVLRQFFCATLTQICCKMGAIRQICDSFTAVSRQFCDSFCAKLTQICCKTGARSIFRHLWDRIATVLRQICESLTTVSRQFCDIFDANLLQNGCKVNFSKFVGQSCDSFTTVSRQFCDSFCKKLTQICCKIATAFSTNLREFLRQFRDSFCATLTQIWVQGQIFDTCEAELRQFHAKFAAVLRQFLCKIDAHLLQNGCKVNFRMWDRMAVLRQICESFTAVSRPFCDSFCTPLTQICCKTGARSILKFRHLWDRIATDLRQICESFTTVSRQFCDSFCATLMQICCKTGARSIFRHLSDRIATVSRQNLRQFRDSFPTVICTKLTQMPTVQVARNDPTMPFWVGPATGVIWGILGFSGRS